MTKTTADTMFSPIGTAGIKSPSAGLLAAGWRIVAAIPAFRTQRRLRNQLLDLSRGQLRDLSDDVLRDAGIEPEHVRPQHGLDAAGSPLLMLAMSMRG